MKIVNIQDEGESQVIRIPDDLKINDDKAYIKKIGSALYIIPFHNPWQNVSDSLENFTSDFMDDRNQPSEQEVRESFD